MSYFFKEYFTFTSKEKKGVFLLLLIIIILIVILIINPFDKKNEKVNVKQIKNEISALNSLILNDIQSEENINNIHPVNFDPNTVSDSVWRSMGLPAKLFNTLDKYRQKGGKIFKAEDLLKIYGFSEELYNKIKIYVKISAEHQHEKSHYEDHHYEKKEGHYYDDKNNTKQFYNNDTIEVLINTASKEELMQIPGIGESYSDRILKYREMLGGFIHIDQLLEVYGFTPELVDQIREHISIKPEDIKKLKINKEDFKDLLKHPYLEYNQVRMICNYREDYKINSIKNLTRNNIISKEQAKKLKPYLDFE